MRDYLIHVMTNKCDDYMNGFSNNIHRIIAYRFLHSVTFTNYFFAVSNILSNRY